MAVLGVLLASLGSAALADQADGIRPAQSPFATPPSAPGHHIDQIKTMPANTWLELGPPQADPQCGVALGRAWSSKMAYAPDWRGAFIYGEGKHGAFTMRNGRRHYNDDLFFYDINAHRWVCVYPGTPLGAYTLTIDADGFEVDAGGRPIPVASAVHGYAMITYDPGRRLFWHVPAPGVYWRKVLPERAAFVKKHKTTLNGLGKRQFSKRNQASPWAYDTVAGHWRRWRTDMKAPVAGFGAHLVYVPANRKLFFLGKGGAHWYDPDARRWQAVNASGPPPPKPIDAASCYDSKRQRIYIAMGSYGKGTPIETKDNRLWAYDLATNAWLDLKPTGQTKPPQLEIPGGTNASLLHCDTANDIVLYLSRGPGAGVHIYSPARNEWVLDQAAPLPASWGKRKHHGFYDPVLNVHFVYVAGDSQDDGSMFVYKYSPVEASTGTPRQ